jgi:hypothetical protein
MNIWRFIVFLMLYNSLVLLLHFLKQQISYGTFRAHRLQLMLLRASDNRRSTALEPMQKAAPTLSSWPSNV